MLKKLRRTPAPAGAKTTRPAARPRLGILRATREQSVVGLDIGSRMIKLVALKKGPNGAKLEVVATAALPPDAVSDGEVVDPVAVISTIRELANRHALPTRRVATAVSGRAIIVKTITMDRVPDAEMPHAVQWEAEQHIPFDLNEVYLDYQVLSVDEAARKQNVLIVAAKKEGIDNLANMVREAGLSPTIVDVDAFAAQNAVLAAVSREGNGCDAIVDIGAEFTNIIVVRDHAPAVSSHISFGTGRLVDAALKHFPASREEIETALVAPNPSDELESAVANATEELSIAIERALTYLDVRGADEGAAVSRLVLCGGGACVPTLVRFLTTRHRLPVHVLDPLDGIDASSVAGTMDLARVAPLLAVGVGLALRDAA